MRPFLATAVLVFFLVQQAASVQFQSTQALPQIRFDEPTSTGFLTGVSTLRAHVEPAGEWPLAFMEFYVDGRFACRATRAPFECSFDAGKDVRARTVVVTAALRDGTALRPQTVVTLGVAITGQVDVSAVVLPVIVQDKQGRVVRGLTRDAFRILEDGAPQPLLSFQSTDVRVDVTIAIDVSGSMQSVLQDARRAVEDFANRFRADDTVSLVAFNDRLYSYQPAGTRTSADERRAFLASLTAQGRTALYDAIAAGVNGLPHGFGSRRAVIVFTDGKDDASRLSPAELQHVLRTNEAVVYLLSMANGTDWSETRDLLRAVASSSGGSLVRVRSVKDVRAAFDRIHDELGQIYLLDYEPPRSDAPGLHRIVVQIPGRPDLVVRTRASYWR